MSSFQTPIELLDADEVVTNTYETAFVVEDDSDSDSEMTMEYEESEMEEEENDDDDGEESDSENEDSDYITYNGFWMRKLLNGFRPAQEAPETPILREKFLEYLRDMENQIANGRLDYLVEEKVLQKMINDLDQTQIGGYFITEIPGDLRLVVNLKEYLSIFSMRGCKEFVTYLVPMETWNTYVGLSADDIGMLALTNPKKISEIDYGSNIVFSEHGQGYVELICRSILY
jgi:hypothetical protein